MRCGINIVDIYFLAWCGLKFNEICKMYEPSYEMIIYEMYSRAEKLLNDEVLF
ncbi:MAG: hypothetical protein AABY36_00875 [Campylobacterota bacterium]